MAQYLQISDGTTTVDLLAGNLKLSADGWRTTTSKEKVWEIIELVSNATDANIRTTKDEIDELAEQARQYLLNPLIADPVWFLWRSEGESAKEALVFDIESEILAHDPLSSPLLGSNVVVLRLAIQRHPEYENSVATYTSSSGVSADGGKWTIGNAAGTSPERMANFIVGTSDAAYIHQKIWLGIRPLYEGVGSFVALWEAEDGSTGSGVTAPADGTASGGNKLLCDLTVTANDGLKSNITIGDIVGSNYNDFIGKYHVLARMKVASAATKVLVELAQYWSGSHSYQGTTFIEGETSWKLYSLGTVSFPPTGDKENVGSASASFQNCGFSIYANSTDDTGSLSIDCYYLIPAEHSLTILGAAVDSSTDLNLLTSPEDQVWGLGDSTQAQGGLQIAPHNWRYPVGGGLLVAVASSDSAHVLSKTLDLEVYLYPRWKTFRV
jgi:hypothetical protein